MGRSGAALIALAIAVQLFLLWRPAYLPTNDGPAHLFSSWAAHRIEADPRDPLARWYEPNPLRIYPNAGYAEFLEACAGAMDVRTAERLALSLYLVALPLGVGFLARTLRRDPLLPALGATVLAYNWLFFLGVFNFLWGVPLVFAYLAVVRRLELRWTWSGVAAANVLLGLLFWFHLVAFAAALLGAGVLVLVRRRIVPALAAALPVLAVAPFFWPRSVAPGAALVWKDSLRAHLEGALTLSVGSAFGDGERVAAVVFGFLLLAGAVVGLVRERRGRAEVAALAGAFLLAAMVAPEAVGVGSVLPERLALFGWLFLLLALDVGRGRRRVAGAALLAVALVAHGLFLVRQFEAFDDRMARFLAGTAVIPKGADFFVLTRVPKGQPYVVRPLATASVYYSLALDTPSFDLYQAAQENRRLFPVTFSEAAMSRFLGEKRLEDLKILELSRWADYVVMWQPIPRQLDRLVARGGYRPLLRRGDLVVLVHDRVRGARPEGG